MLFHHLFLSGRFDGFNVSFWPLTAAQITRVASFCKICVCMFAFVSGYGLILSYEKEKTCGVRTSAWLRNRYIRAFQNYWFIVIIAWIVFMLYNRRPITVYGFETSFFYGIWNALMELLGFTHIIQDTSPLSILGTWWYMGAILAFILLLPTIDLLLSQIGPIATLGLVFLLPRVLRLYTGNCNFYTFFLSFCFGAVFARYEIFKRIDACFTFKKPVLVS